MEKSSNTNSVKVSIADGEDLIRNLSIANKPTGVSSWMINETNVETLFGVKFTSLSDIDDFSMSIKEGKYADIFSTMSSANIDADLSSSPKVSISSPLVSSSTTINVPHELNSIDVAATFGVPLTTVGDLHKLINDIKAGKHKELLYGMTKDNYMETLDALGSICNSIQANCNNLPSKYFPSDPIVQSVDINTKSTSYAGAAGASTMAQPQVNSNFRPLVADLVFNGVNISIPRKVVKKCDECKIFDHVHHHYPKKMASPPIVTTTNVVAPSVEKSNDDFQMVGKKKKRKGKSKSTNGGQFTGPSVKKTIRYEPTTTTSAPKKGATNVSNPSKLSSMLKTVNTSLKNDNFTTSNSFSALNDEEEDDEEVENVYNESANLVPNINTDGSSSFTGAAEVLDHCNNVVPELTFAQTNEMIKEEMPRLVHLAVTKD
nr:zinc knuckle CX2CX4HX4C [Tanacetum cinerariifolium]